MNRKEVVIDIDENGDCSIEGKGFVGPECEKSMKEIEQALGNVSSSQNKPEYNQRAAVRGHNLQRAR